VTEEPETPDEEQALPDGPPAHEMAAFQEGYLMGVGWCAKNAELRVQSLCRTVSDCAMRGQLHEAIHIAQGARFIETVADHLYRRRDRARILSPSDFFERLRANPEAPDLSPPPEESDDDH